MGTTSLLSVWCWLTAGAIGLRFLAVAHHPCLGSQRGLPYSAHRGKQSMNRIALNELKRQIPLLEYDGVAVHTEFDLATA
jgi:hypothetical protein